MPAAVSWTSRPHPAAVTRWRTTLTCGYDRPTQRSPYSTFRPVVAVQRCDTHVLGRHREQRPQRTQRDARNRYAAAAVVVVSHCSRSLAASVACRSHPRRLGNALVLASCLLSSLRVPRHLALQPQSSDGQKLTTSLLTNT